MEVLEIAITPGNKQLTNHYKVEIEIEAFNSYKNLLLNAYFLTFNTT